MSEQRLAGARPQRVIAASLIGVILATLAVFAIRYEGVATADVSLHDGGVWVSKNSEALVGRINYSAGVVDGSVIGPSNDLEIYQHGNNVAVHDRSTDTLQLLDTATVSLQPQLIELPRDAAVTLGASAASITDPHTGDWWVIPMENLPSFTMDEPTFSLGENGQGLLAYDGRAIGVDLQTGTFLEAQAHNPSSLEKPKTEELTQAPPADSQVQLSAVGKTPVLLAQHPQTHAVQLFWGSDKPLDLSAHIDPTEHAILQPPSAASDEVVIATAEHLIRITRDGASHLIAAPRVGVPAAPLQVNGCIYGAWASDISHVIQICGSNETSHELPGSNPGADLKFRVNRDLVVLNDITHGQTWQFDGVLVMIDQWDDARPKSDGNGQSNPNPVNLPENAPIDRTLENRAPNADDDSFGVRAGATVILPVLLNDSDPDGDVLTVRVLQELDSAFGEIEVVNDGRTLQARVSGQAQGEATITYEADDGREGTDTATVTLEVIPDAVNRPPEQLHAPQLTIQSGGNVKAYVLGEVVDPDGDAVYLCGATGADGVRVEADPSGYIEIHSSGSTSGQRELKIGLSDGRGDCEYSGAVHVFVQPSDAATPVPVYDHLIAHPGVPTEIYPLENDLSPSGGPLQLSYVSESPGLEVTALLKNAKVEITAEGPGVHYLEYTVLDESGASAIGLIRVDVTPYGSGAPQTAADTALLRPMESVLIDPTENDRDPAGAVLSIADVTAPPELAVAIIDHHLLRISAPAGLEEPTSFHYTVTNGSSQSTGEVTVVPLAEAEQALGPQAVHDHARVRAGDYVTVPVLANDKHPSGQILTLDPTLEDVADLGGTMFATGQVVRFLAPDEPGVASATYTVTDEAGKSASGHVTITVVENNDENTAPTPPMIRGRVTASDRVQIPVDLTGTDPDGDSVTFHGIIQPPQYGRIVEVAPDYFVYEAFADSQGTDKFTYSVTDRWGLAATGKVEIGVLPRAEQNRPPVSIPDYFLVQPGKTAQLDPLLNDADPDGDPITFAELGVESSDLTAKILGTRVQIDAPEEEGTYSLQYWVTDSMSPPVPGVITLEVRHDAPLHPPVAADDVLRVADIVNQTEVTVPVLDNDYDPDGPHDELKLSLPLAEQTAQVVGQDLVVPVGDHREIVMYQVTDADNRSTYAFVDIPGRLDSAPELRPDVSAVTVPSGQVVDIAVNDYIHSPRDVPVMVREDQPVSASNSAGNEKAVTSQTLRYQSAPGYVGPASITATFADAPDGEGPSSVLTIPITVTPDGPVAPTLRGTVVDVPTGGEEVTIDLSAVTTNPAQEPVTYSLENVDPNLNARITDDVLTLSVPDYSSRGHSLPFQVKLSSPSHSTQASFTARAVGSNAPLMVAMDDSLGELAPGGTGRINVLANDVNPFPHEPLQLVSATMVVGEGQVRIEGQDVVITAASGYFGAIEVAYTAMDATADPSRSATARVRAVVPSPPAQMAAPGIHSVGDGHVVLQLSAPDSGGAGIDDYVISYGAEQMICTTTVCRIDGLTNGRDYTFTAIARNAYGQSPPSAPSAVARPNRVPQAPSAPTLVPGNSTLTMTWAAPAGTSDALDYDVEISPAPRGLTQRRTQATSMEWTNLTNGTSYRARVRAMNSSGQIGPWSPWSSEVVPVGPPAQPTVPQVSLTQGSSHGSAHITWSAPAAHGSAITGYELAIFREGKLVDTKSVGPRTTSATVSTDHGAAYQFAVTARNAAGTSPRSDLSQAVKSVEPLGTPSGVVGVGTGVSQQVHITHSGVSAPGRTITYEYQVRTAAGKVIALGKNQATSGAFTVDVANGTSLTAQVRACDGGSCGEWSANSAPFAPFHQQLLPAPQLSMSAAVTKIIFQWSNGAHADEVAAVRYRAKQEGGAWSDWKVSQSANGSSFHHALPDTCVTLQIQAQDHHGNWGSSAEVSVATHPVGTPLPYPAPRSC